MTAPASKCLVCKAPAGVECTSLITGGPLPGRSSHIGRVVATLSECPVCHRIWNDVGDTGRCPSCGHETQFDDEYGDDYLRKVTI